MIKDLKLLGFKVKDMVTGFKGVVSSIGYDLYGCVQAVVTPEADKTGKMEDSRWFDTKRLEITSKKPVMPVPSFEEEVKVPGGFSHPTMHSDPSKR